MGMRPSIEDLTRWITPRGLRRRAHAVALDDAGHGHDRFGMSRQGVALGLGISAPLYERWFRVEHHGIEHIPAEGGVLLAANHSGTLPFDGLMIWHDVTRHAQPPRALRVVLDHFVSVLPWISTVFARAGAFGGSRGNLHTLLESGERVLVFPEGVRGIGKPFTQRYQLQRWTEGHAEMAIRHQVPVVPVGLVGAEEQMPQIARLPVAAFGAPYLPLPLVPLPLPVRYHIHYGAPVPVAGRYTPDEADNPDAVEFLALEIRDRVADLIAAGLEARDGVFA